MVDLDQKRVEGISIDGSMRCIPGRGGVNEEGSEGNKGDANDERRASTSGLGWTCSEGDYAPRTSAAHRTKGYARVLNCFC
jgi:hypothetical protein